MSRQRTHSLILCLVTAAACFHLAAPHASAEKLLRWKLKKGDAFDVKMTQDIKQQMKVADQDVDITQKMEMFVTWQVVDVDQEAIIHLVQSIDQITMDMNVPGIGEFKIDTAVQEAPEGLGKSILDMIKPLVNVKITQKMNDRGEVLDVEIPEDALKGLNANPITKQFFSGDAFKDMMRKASPALPEEPVTPGFVWNRVNQIASPVGDMRMSNTFTYVGEEQRDGRTVDKISADVKMEFLGGANNPLGAAITVSDQENKGEMYFDAEAGRFVETQLNQRMTMKMDVAGQSINQKIDNKTVMTITPKAGP